MSEGDTDGVVSLQEVLEEDQHLEDTANAVLGDSDDTQCTYPKGYVYRQALYACDTCTPEGVPPAGVCLACSLGCHEGHTLHELYTKRHFRCDCGNGKFSNFKCSICPEKEGENVKNKYNQNFSGLYCTCHRPYPDPEDEVEDDMIQCCVCEDWFHSRHLTGETPTSFSEMSCDTCMKSHDFLSTYQLRTNPVTITKEENGAAVNVTDTPPTTTCETGTSSAAETKSDSFKSDDKDGTGINVCELVRRRRLLSNCEGGDRKTEAGFFEENWRSQLCTCDSCKEMYSREDVLFLLDEGDSVGAYEKRGVVRLSSHDAGMEALGSTLDRVQQGEVFHQYNELKTELSDFLRDFARQGQVVSKRDIEGFFEEMQARKRQRLDTGEGVPPAQCHY
ncbi:putative E3 ubiquitin-protein ligase UBR7 [Halichondria panicea]|uniref:putative E3 ubiquitin-protein ligase UBR7 n=1 Tax=Halichondria panicea TaxID=6063 RepID=UPI00312B56A1